MTTLVMLTIFNYVSATHTHTHTGKLNEFANLSLSPESFHICWLFRGLQAVCVAIQPNDPTMSTFWRWPVQLWATWMRHCL